MIEDGKRRGGKGEKGKRWRREGQRGNGMDRTGDIGWDGEGKGKEKGEGKGGEGLRPPNFNSWRRHCFHDMCWEYFMSKTWPYDSFFWVVKTDP